MGACAHSTGSVCSRVLRQHTPSFDLTVVLLPSFFGTIAQNEVWLYLFDAAPLWISMTLFVFVWPPRYINGTDTACTGPSAVAGGWNAARHDGAAELGTLHDNTGRHKRHMPPPADAGRRWGHGGERT